jgi:ring-1,2-phenylacetyl-CoA epoxidase subunit PaaE
MSQFHKLTIQSITRETEKAISISFNVPESLKENFKFKAGQYLTLRAFIDGNEVRRDYSICSSINSGLLKVAVKEVENGVFSTYANRNLKVGDDLDVATPNGRFVFEPDTTKRRTIAAFAAGSGITPIMGIAKTLLEEEPNSNFILVYGNKTPNDAIFYEELNALKISYPNRFYIQEVYSQCDEEGALFGRIEKSVVNYALKNRFKDFTIDDYYLCGPEEMINNVTETLTEKGITKEVIHFELFTTPVNTENKTIEVSDGNSQVTVVVDDEEITFDMPQNKTILEVALAENIDAPYSCQGGVCSSCIARITDGEATMRQNNILTDSELAEGLILTCQAQPTTAQVTVDYDDV